MWNLTKLNPGTGTLRPVMRERSGHGREVEEAANSDEARKNLGEAEQKNRGFSIFS